MERARTPENRQPAAGALSRSVSRRAIRSLLGDNPRSPAAQAGYLDYLGSLAHTNRELARVVMFCDAFHAGRGLYTTADVAAHQKGLLLYVRAQELAVRGEGRRLAPLTEADTANLLTFYVRSLSPETQQAVRVAVQNEFSEAELAELQRQTDETPPGTYLPGEGVDQWWQSFFSESITQSPFYEQHVELMEQTAEEHRNVAAAVAAIFAASEPVFATEMLQAQMQIEPHAQAAAQMLLGATDAWQMLRLRSDPEFGGA